MFQGDYCELLGFGSQNLDKSVLGTGSNSCSSAPPIHTILKLRLYNSRSLNQKIVAVVERITSDGHYDLDVKKSADPKNFSPYVAPWLNL